MFILYYSYPRWGGVASNLQKWRLCRCSSRVSRPLFPTGQLSRSTKPVGICRTTCTFVCPQLDPGGRPRLTPRNVKCFRLFSDVSVKDLRRASTHGVPNTPTSGTSVRSRLGDAVISCVRLLSFKLLIAELSLKPSA